MVVIVSFDSLIKIKKLVWFAVLSPQKFKISLTKSTNKKKIQSQMGATGYSKSNISHPNPKIGSAQKSILLIFDVIGQETRNFQVADKLFWILIWLGLGLGLDLEFVLTHTRNWFSGLLYYCDYLVIWFMDRFLPLISLFLSACYAMFAFGFTWQHTQSHTVLVL